MLQRFTFGNEALDYLQCRLWEEGGPISACLWSAAVGHQCEVSAHLPPGVDIHHLYRFRTDIFWGWPQHPGPEIGKQLVDFVGDLLAKRESVLAIRELMIPVSPEPDETLDVPHFLCPPTQFPREHRACHFLAGARNLPDEIRRFVLYGRDSPLIVTDLDNHPEALREVRAGGEVGAATLAAIVQNVSHIVVTVYDGRAFLIWTRLSQEELAGKWQRLD
jgi:hypothetical protein